MRVLKTLIVFSLIVMLVFPQVSWAIPCSSPAEFVGQRIRIKAKSSGNAWDGTVTEPVIKADGSVLYRYSARFFSAACRRVPQRYLRALLMRS